MAEGVLRQRVAERGLPLPVEIDSAGTHGYHHGAPPDARAQAAALRRGVDISRLRARRVTPEDFERFDLVLAMDDENHAALLELAAEEHHGKVRLLLEFAGDAGAAAACRIPTTGACWASSGCSISSRRPWLACSTNSKESQSVAVTKWRAPPPELPARARARVIAAAGLVLSGLPAATVSTPPPAVPVQTVCVVAGRGGGGGGGAVQPQPGRSAAH